ncbi:MAG: signal peptidase I [Nanoarchaeota archaeon]|nr:signal peptidase I [Nanoarchaeota archaeon]
MEKEVKNIKEEIKKSWDWLWHSDSLLSWVVALIFAFIIVKFIFFPLISVILATKLPLVVVESGSMSHPGSFFGNTFSTHSAFNEWWQSSFEWYESHNIQKSQAEYWPLRTGLEKGDIVVVYGWSKPHEGDIIIFNANQQYPIIHRVVKIETINNELIYSTKGDNFLTNQDQLDIEKQIPESAIIGKAAFRIPKLGWLKLFFVEIINKLR